MLSLNMRVSIEIKINFNYYLSNYFITKIHYYEKNSVVIFNRYCRFRTLL